jgi:hypothetical protein
VSQLSHRVIFLREFFSFFFILFLPASLLSFRLICSFAFPSYLTPPFCPCFFPFYFLSHFLCHLPFTARFQILTAASMKTAFYDAAPCSLAEITDISKVLASSIIRAITQTTRRNNLEDSHLHTSRRENLRSQQRFLYKICIQIAAALYGRTQTPSDSFTTSHYNQPSISALQCNLIHLVI